jgi:MFS family permease
VVGLTIMAIGLGWIAAITSTTVSYPTLVPAFVMSGAGMGLFFAPIANVVLSAVPREEEGKASGANNTIRELGGVFGIAVLGAIFSATGSYASPQTYTAGLIPGVWTGAAVVAVGAALALALPAAVARLQRAKAPVERLLPSDAELAA